jgi:AcrR family transcriptional regulator
MNQRTAQIDRTRQAILDAAIDTYLGEADPSELTMQNIADAAGVSHRTLYRYFPSRQELTNAIGKEMDRRTIEGGVWTEVTSFEVWTSGIEDVVAFGAAHREQLRRTLTLSLATGEYRTDRDEMYWELFQERFPHLDERTAREAFLCIRALLSAANVILMGERFDLSPDDLAPVIDFGVHALVEHITALDAAAAEASS